MQYILNRFQTLFETQPIPKQFCIRLTALYRQVRFPKTVLPSNFGRKKTNQVFIPKIFPKSIIKDLIPIQVCNIDSVTDTEKGQINKLSKYFPTIAITHKQINSSTIDELEKLGVDIVVSSEKNMENLKPSILTIFDVKSTENTISGARVEISFSKNSAFEKWKNESVACRENSESCKLIYQKSMIKKPDFRITSSSIKSEVQQT
jgi:hypothetical protein